MITFTDKKVTYCMFCITCKKSENLLSCDVIGQCLFLCRNSYLRPYNLSLTVYTSILWHDHSISLESSDICCYTSIHNDSWDTCENNCRHRTQNHILGRENHNIHLGRVVIHSLCSTKDSAKVFVILNNN